MLPREKTPRNARLTWFAKHVFRFMEDQGYRTEAELAEALSVNKDVVNRWKNNASIPQGEELLRIMSIVAPDVHAAMIGEDSTPRTHESEKAEVMRTLRLMRVKLEEIEKQIDIKV